MTVSTNASRLRRVSRAFLWMSIRSVLGNWIARHNQLLWFRSNGQRLERSQVPHPNLAFVARLGWDSTTASIFGFCRRPTTVFPTADDQRLVFPTTVFLTLPCFLSSLLPNERIVQSRQRIELRRFLQILLRFRRISVSPVSLAQPIEILRILQVCLLEFRNCLSVIFFRQRNSSRQLMRLFQLRVVLPGLGPLAEFLRMTLRRSQIFFPDRY